MKKTVLSAVALFAALIVAAFIGVYEAPEKPGEGGTDYTLPQSNYDADPWYETTEYDGYTVTKHMTMGSPSILVEFTRNDTLVSVTITRGSKTTLVYSADGFSYDMYLSYKNDTYIIAGYSLSGLFAIWSFYETQLFKGLICCSASLWFDGWESYAATSSAPGESIVYLSLGGKEADSPNMLMASIGSKYKNQEKLCKADKNITKTVFEMNSGGHFANPPKRISKGIIRILKELQG